MSEVVEELKLTGKQKLFADYYVGEANLNATKAARLAGYSGNANTLGVTGYELLRNPKIQAYIQNRLDELTMTSKEVLLGFTNEAKGSIADVLDENGEFDYVGMCKKGADKLLKKLKIKTTHKYDPATKQTSTEVVHEFEMYDAQAAKVHLGKAHGIFVDKSEIEHKGTIVTNLILPKVDDSADAT